VIDCAMTDGSASLMAMIYGMRAAGAYSTQRGTNPIGGAAPNYDTYRCADGRWLALGALEPQFFQIFLEKAGIADPSFSTLIAAGRWQQIRARLAKVIAAKTRDEWSVLFGDSDACVTPVLDLDEAPRHAHNQARHTFVVVDDVLQPAPAPRFSATPGKIQGPPPTPGADTREVLRDWGISDAASAPSE
jgi:alpha-methylacyl-CoA racemase